MALLYLYAERSGSMPSPMKILLLYLAGISLIAVAATVLDKSRARRHKWRVPEATLLGIAALGGSAAMWITMKAIRHKTRHRKFMWGIPAIFLVQCAAGCLLWWLVGRNLSVL